LRQEAGGGQAHQSARALGEKGASIHGWVSFRGQESGVRGQESTTTILSYQTNGPNQRENVTFCLSVIRIALIRLR
jgi:hypothetical protein